MAFEMWKLEIKEQRAKTQAHEDFRAGLHNVVLGQCTEASEERLRSHAQFPAANQNGVALLVLIKSLTHTFEERMKLSDSLCDAREQFCHLQQGRRQSLQRHHELPTSQVEVMEEVGVAIPDVALVNEIAAANGRAHIANDADWEQARQQALAIRFIRGTNDNCKGHRTHLRNTFLDGTDVCPATLHEACNILQRRETETSQAVVGGDGVAFVADGTAETPGRQQRDLSHITCFNCGQTGHYSNQCPDEQGTVNVVNGVESPSGFSFSQPGASRIPKEWVLLDNQSTVHLFCNRNLLTNMRKIGSRMAVHCNAGVRCTQLVGDLPGFGQVWCDPRAIANILSFSQVQRKHHVTCDSDGGNKFNVVKPCGKRFEFVQSESGLHHLDTSKADQGVEESGNVLVGTVASKKAKCTNEDYSKALLAREMQIRMGQPSTKEFLRIISKNLPPNCPANRADVMAAEDIFGPDVGSPKGKTTRQRPDRVRPELTNIPSSAMDRHRTVALCADLMFINGIPMLVAVSRNIRFGTVEALPNQLGSTLANGIGKVKDICSRGGFRVEIALMDGQFETIRGDLANKGITLSATSEDEHVGDIERHIRTVKERVRATHNTLPFTKMPPRMIIEMAKSSVYWLNAFPNPRGVSDTLSPRASPTKASIA